MAITPRKEETSALVEILDSGAFDDPTQMAGALYKRSAQLIQERDGKEGVGLYLVVLEGAPFGPFYGSGEAATWARAKQAELGLQGRVLRLWAPGTYDLDEDRHREPLCPCGHPKQRHVEVKKRDQVRYAECGVWFPKDKQWCACTSYQRETGR